MTSAIGETDEFAAITARMRELRDSKASREADLEELALRALQCLRVVLPNPDLYKKGSVNDYLDNATLLVGSIQDPLILRKAIAHFDYVLEHLRHLEVGRRDNWERFYRVSIERLQSRSVRADGADTSCLVSILKDHWAMLLRPDWDLKEARALLACRQARRGAELRLRAEAELVGRIQARYLEGEAEVERLKKAGILTREDIERLDTTIQGLILVGRMWELSQFWARKGYKIAIHGQSLFYSGLVDFHNARYPCSSPFVYRMRELKKGPLLTCEDITARYQENESYTDWKCVSDVISFSAWPKDNAGCESAIDFCLSNGNISSSVAFVDPECPHGKACGGTCVPLRMAMDKFVRSVATRKLHSSFHGDLYVVAVRPHKFKSLMYEAYPLGAPCFEKGMAPTAAELFTHPPRECESIEMPVQYRGMAHRLSLQCSGLRISRVTNVQPCVQVAVNARMAAAAKALASYDRQYTTLDTAGQKVLIATLLKDEAFLPPAKPKKPAVPGSCRKR